MKRFRLLVADPPWRFGDDLPGPKRGAASHYPTMSPEDIARFPLPPLADDAVLVLWRVASMLQEALYVARTWGFKPKAELVWVKTKKTDLAALSMGMGRTVRNCHEVAIIATRGRPPRSSAAERSVIFAPRGEHSRKPEESYALIERLYPGPYVELFARRERRRWTCFGRELLVSSEPQKPHRSR